MDLMYLPDAFTFHVIRSPAYDARDYLDAAWEEEEERKRRRQKGGQQKDKGGVASANATEMANRSGHQKKSPSAGKDACPMCKERRRRTLATYIRTKSRQDSERTIEEEEEGPEEACGTKEESPTRGTPRANALRQCEK
ncbi:uncharacterized protein [Hetaerina americana]|uniref:uncharacterized protein n=1 Tax=Hetaerina americana TaxID=62018 RepID=UPI003A7F2FEA